jgi:hypothetical protein
MTGNPVVETFALANDTGTPGDGVTSDATLAGTLSAGYMAGVQFDFQGDGMYDAQTMADSQGAFTYNPGAQLGYGSASVRARALEWDSSVSDYVYGDWTAPLNFAFQPENIAEPSLTLHEDTGTPGDNVTNNATVAINAAPSQMVELDWNGDGNPDTMGSTDGSGVALIDLGYQIAYGEAHVRARALEWDSILQGYRSSDWSEPLTFTFAPDPIAAPTLSLANDTGTPDDQVTTDATVSVTAAANQNIELDMNGDGYADAMAYTGSGGSATYNLAGQAGYGEVEVRARAGQWDSIQQGYRYSDWSGPLSFTFAPDPIAAPTLALVNDTGNPSDGITADATLSGTAGAYQMVELDLNGDGMADLTTYADYTGNFIHDGGSQIPEGIVDASARAAEYDTNVGGYRYSEWSAPISFVYENIGSWEVPTPMLSLVNDNGAPNDNITSDGRLTGTTGANLSVALDYNGDGTTDDWATADAAGQFTIDASAHLADGPVTVYARSAQWSEALGEYVYSASTSLGFSYYENLPPEILTFTCSTNSPGIWTFSGTVRDDHNGVVRVTFGGVLAGHSALIEYGTSFSYTVTLGAVGWATAQVEDDYHVASNIMEVFVSA